MAPYCTKFRDAEQCVNSNKSDKRHKKRSTQKTDSKLMLKQRTNCTIQDLSPQNPHAFILRKLKKEHDLDEVGIKNLVRFIQSPVAILRDVDKKKRTESFVILTEQTAKDLNGREAPVMAYLRPDNSGNYIASAYAKTENDEQHYIGLLNSGNLLAIDKNKIASLNLTGEAKSSFESVRTGDKVIDLSRSTPHNVPQSAAGVNGQNISSAGCRKSTMPRKLPPRETPILTYYNM